MDLLEAILNLPKEEAKNALTILDPLERQVLEVLLKKKVALTAQQIIDSLVEELADNIIERANELAEKMAIEIRVEDPEFYHFENVTSGEFRMYRTSGEIDVCLFEKTFYPGKTYTKLSQLVEALNTYFSEINKAKTKTGITNLKKKLVSKFAEIPSFRRIETTVLPELIATGLIIAREPVSKKRAKKLYAVNPVLLEVF